MRILPSLACVILRSGDERHDKRDDRDTDSARNLPFDRKYDDNDHAENRRVRCDAPVAVH